MSNQIENVEKHNISFKGFYFHKAIYPIAVTLILLFIISTALDPKAMGEAMEAIKQWILKNMDQFILIGLNLFVVFCLVLAFTPLGSIKLGGKQAKPEFTNVGWFAMMFAAGMGAGLVYWGVTEPVATYTGWFHTPFNVEPKTQEAYDLAMATSIFHWGVHPWSIYLTVAIIVGYFSYNRKTPMALSSALEPLVGKNKLGSVLETIVEVFMVIITIMGLASSVGLSTSQATEGVAAALEFSNSYQFKALSIFIIILIASGSIWLGVAGGVRRLSNLNIGIAMALLLFVIVTTGVGTYLSTLFRSLGNYVMDIIPLSNWIDRPDIDWVQGWTVFYWAWWCAWGPLVGIFIAKVSKGRSFREMIIAGMLLPTIFCAVWMVAFGGGAIETIIAGKGELVNGIQAATKSTFQFLDVLPVPAISTFLFLTLAYIFIITSVDSGVLVADSLATGGIDKSHTLQKIFWAAKIGLVAAMLLLIGGDAALNVIQTLAIDMGLPFMMILLVLILGFIKALISDRKRDYYIEE